MAGTASHSKHGILPVGHLYLISQAIVWGSFVGPTKVVPILCRQFALPRLKWVICRVRWRRTVCNLVPVRHEVRGRAI